jgi:hypothetical protein
MFGCVLVPGTVAAADVSARQAKAQMHPSVSDSQAVFASWRARRHRSDLIQVSALFCHLIVRSTDGPAVIELRQLDLPLLQVPRWSAIACAIISRISLRRRSPVCHVSESRRLSLTHF